MVKWDIPLQMVSGPYKMMSNFIRTLLTPKGDIIGRPNEGTEFYDLMNGSVGGTTDLQMRIQLILEDCFSQVREMQGRIAEKNAIPDDELLVSYTIRDFYISTDASRVSVKIELSNAAGQSVTGLVPLGSGGLP